MRRILLIIPASQGTIPKVAFNIYKALTEQKDLIVYVANLSPNGESGYPPNIEFKFTGKQSNWSKVVFLSKLKKRLNIDISISTLLGCNTLNIISKRKDKTFGIFHAPLHQTKKLGLFTYVKCLISYKFILNRLDRIFAVSQSVKDDLKRYVKKQVEVVYNIHDFEFIKFLAEEDLTTEEKLIFENPTILCVGNLFISKGVNRLLSSFAVAKKKMDPSVNLVFVGADGKKNVPVEFVDYARELGIEKNTFFLGYQTNPYKYMKRCVSLVSPSYSEGLPGVLIEALSLGKKVITTNSSQGVWEILQCTDLYDENLDYAFETSLGYITPNLENREELNIQVLADCLLKAESFLSLNDNDFIAERFSKHTIVNHFITNEGYNS